MTSVLNECLRDFPTRMSAEEGTEDLPCELGAWKKNVFAILPTGFGLA